MPFFMVTGKSKSSGRRIKPDKLMAVHAEAATAQAKKKGIIPEQVELLKVTHFICDVVGTSHSNPDGTERQAIVKKLKRLEPIVLRHEIGNRHDKHALQTLRATGEQIGYVPKELADAVVDGYSTNGPCLCAAVSLGIVPVGDSQKLVTTRLLVVFALAGSEKELVSAYLRELSSGPDCEVTAEQIPQLVSLQTVESRHQLAKAKMGSGTPPRKAGCLGAILLGFTVGLCGFASVWLYVFSV